MPPIKDIGMITNQFVEIADFTKFSTLKLSLNSDNTQYVTNYFNNVDTGVPDIGYNSIVVNSATGLMWSKGKFISKVITFTIDYDEQLVFFYAGPISIGTAEDYHNIASGLYTYGVKRVILEDVNSGFTYQSIWNSFKEDFICVIDTDIHHLFFHTQQIPGFDPGIEYTTFSNKSIPVLCDNNIQIELTTSNTLNERWAIASDIARVYNKNMRNIFLNIDGKLILANIVKATAIGTGADWECSYILGSNIYYLKSLYSSNNEIVVTSYPIMKGSASLVSNGAIGSFDS